MALPEQQHSVESLIEETLFSFGNLKVDSSTALHDSIKLLTERTVKLFQYDRTGVWLFNENKRKLTAEDIYIAKLKAHSSGHQVQLSGYPLYLEILRSVRTHALSTIDESSVPSEILSSYFKKNDIRSIISSGIWFKGELIGVVSASTVGRNHHWSLQEKLYFASLGDLISKWMHQALVSKNDSKKQRISLRKLVKELSILCSRANFIGFHEATQFSLKSINDIVHASKTSALVIEDKECLILSSNANEPLKIPIEIGKRLFILSSNSKVIWIPNTSKSNHPVIKILEKIGVKKSSAILIAPFGTNPDLDFHGNQKNTHGVVCIEFSTNIPKWNDGLKEVLLCATDAFSILAQDAQTKALYRESLGIARASFEHSTVGMTLFDTSGKILKINRSLSQMIKTSKATYQTESIQNILPWIKDHLINLERIKDGTQQNYQFEETLGHDDSSSWGLFNISFIPTKKDTNKISDGYFLMQVIDITQRKKALIELAAQRTFFRTVIDTDPNLIFAKDTHGVFTLANQAVANAYGTTVENIIGKTDAHFNNDHNQVNSFSRDDQLVLREGKTLNAIEEEITDASGKIRNLLTVKSPIFDDLGRPVYVLGVSTDITERKKSEQKKQALLKKLEHTQKLESLGILASGIAHDFNNLLLGIIGNSALALKNLEDNHPATEFLNKTVRTAENAAELTAQLLSYSGKGSFFKTPLELTSVVQETSTLVERITEKKGKLVFSVSTKDIVIDADIGQLRQVILNLITNAADAIENTNGEIIIKTYTQYLHASPQDSVCDDFVIQAGWYGVFEVADNGCGMTEEVKRNIFDPFFTTKFTGRGLGLASVLGIVKAHKGILCVESSPGRGSIFKAYIPLSKQEKIRQTNQKETTRNPENFSLSGLHILLVEDEIIPREVCTYMLESSGCTVLTACNGEDGLALYQQNKNLFSAIVLDLTMPKLDGREVFEKIRQKDKNIPILLTSGYHEKEFGVSFSEDLFSTFIQKPFVPKTLELALAALLLKASASKTSISN